MDPELNRACEANLDIFFEIANSRDLTDIKEYIRIFASQTFFMVRL